MKAHFYFASSHCERCPATNRLEVQSDHDLFRQRQKDGA